MRTRTVLAFAVALLLTAPLAVLAQAGGVGGGAGGAPRGGGFAGGVGGAMGAGGGSGTRMVPGAV